MLNVTEEKSASVTIVLIDGRADGVTAPDLEDRIGKIVERGDVDVLLDCKKMEYISSAGLRVLLVVARKCEQNCGKLSICALQADCKSVIEIGGFETVIDCYDTREAALAAAAQRGATC